MAQLDTGNSQTVGVPRSLLMQTLDDVAVQPGTPPSYEACKIIYAYHPLGGRMVDKPIQLAQSRPRKILIPGEPAETKLAKEFAKVWRKLGRVGADRLIHNVCKTARIYGIASMGVGTRGADPSERLDVWSIHADDLYFQMFDPLNTAGSLTIQQDTRAEDFMKPRQLRVGPQAWHPSRGFVMLNEEPVYILWTDSAFGFSGRSVYQRALYPLRSYLRTMITDEMIARKAGALVYKAHSPGSIIDGLVRVMFGHKRQAVKDAETNQVISVGIDEDIQSIDLHNIRDTAEFARTNILKNIATAANMPAQLLNQETLTEGFGEGTEDAKQIAAYVQSVRVEMQPLYDWLDNIVMHLAWPRELYEAVKSDDDVSYEETWQRWHDAFVGEWPSLIEEPDSDAVERETKIMESAVGVVEAIAPMADQGNKARLAEWLAGVMNSREALKSDPLDIDVDEMEAYEPPSPMQEPTREPETNATYDI